MFRRREALLTAQRGGGPAPFPFMEVDVTPNPLLALCGAVAPDADGTLAVPTAPGLGFELRPKQLEPYLASHWVEEG